MAATSGSFARNSSVAATAPPNNNRAWTVLDFLVWQRIFLLPVANWPRDNLSIDDPLQINAGGADARSCQTGGALAGLATGDTRHPQRRSIAGAPAADQDRQTLGNLACVAARQNDEVTGPASANLRLDRVNLPDLPAVMLHSHIIAVVSKGSPIWRFPVGAASSA
jgi:hypothetical protein